jgi:hypothetical protein
MTVQLQTSWKRHMTPALFRRQFPSHRPQSRPRARRRTRTQSPSRPPCLFYADTVRRSGDTQQTLRRRKDLRWITFLFVAPSGPIASLRLGCNLLVSLTTPVGQLVVGGSLKVGEPIERAGDTMGSSGGGRGVAGNADESTPSSQSGPGR